MFDVNKAVLLSTCAILMRIFLTESDSKDCELIYCKTSFHLKMISLSKHIKKELAPEVCHESAYALPIYIDLH